MSEVFDHWPTFLGEFYFFAPFVGIHILLALYLRSVSRRMTDESLANLIIWLLVVDPLLLAGASWLSDAFWSTWLLYLLLYVVIFSTFSKMLLKLLSHTGGSGVLAVPGYVAMMSFTGALMGYGVVSLYQWITS